MNVALWSGAALDNWGDRAIARITEEQLGRRLPAARFVHFSPWRGDCGVEPLWIDRTGRWPGSGQFDAVVVAGGGVLAGPPFKHPLMQAFCLGSQPRCFDPSAVTIWNAVGVQDGVLPPVRPEHRDYLAAVRDRLDVCTVRGRDAAAWIGADARGELPPVVPDPVFALPPLRHRARGKRQRPTVGVAVGAAVPSRAFLASLTRTAFGEVCPSSPSTCASPETVAAWEFSPADMARKRRFVPCIAAALTDLSRVADLEFFGFGSMYGDGELARALSALIPQASILEGACATADEWQHRFERYDAIVLSRFHCAILALRARCPFVAVDPHWSPARQTSKLHQLLVRFGLERWYWTVRSDSEDEGRRLGETLTALLEQRAVDPSVYDTAHGEAVRHFDRLSDALRARVSVRHTELQPSSWR